MGFALCGWRMEAEGEGGSKGVSTGRDTMIRLENDTNFMGSGWEKLGAGHIRIEKN